MPWESTGYLKWLPPLTWQCDHQIAGLLRAVPSGARIVDLGSGGRKLSDSVMCVDFIAFENTDVIADVHRLPFCNESVDIIFATGLLEHVDDPRVIVQEAARVLRPGGLMHVEVPFLQQFHEDPIDYRRYTISGLKRELERHGLGVQKAGFHIGPTVAVITLLTYYAAMWFNGRRLIQKAVSTAVFALASAVLWPFRYLDVIAKRRSDAHRLCFGVYCTAMKPHSGASDLT